MFGPDARNTAAAAGGWNAAPPSPPSTSNAPSASGDEAQPTQLSTMTDNSGPAKSSTRGRQRSASAPKPSCDTDEAIWKHIASVPTAVSDSPSCGMNNGSRGA